MEVIEEFFTGSVEATSLELGVCGSTGPELQQFFETKRQQCKKDYECYTVTTMHSLGIKFIKSKTEVNYPLHKECIRTMQGYYRDAYSFLKDLPENDALTNKLRQIASKIPTEFPALGSQ